MTWIPADWAVLILLSLAAGISLPLLLVVPLALTVLLPLAPPAGGIGLLATSAPAALGTLLLLTGLLVRAAPGVRQLWRGVLALSVLPTALILPVLALDPGRSGWSHVGAVLIAVVLAGSTQGLRLGGELLNAWGSDGTDEDAGRPRRGPLSREEGAGAALAVLLVLGAWTGPGLFVIPALVLWLLAMLRLKPRLRACRFATVLGSGVARHLAGDFGWRTGRAVPDWIPRPPSDGGKRLLRGTPAGWSASVGRGTFQDGWFVTGPDGPAFFYRSPLRTWEVELGPASRGPGEKESLSWGVRIPMTLEGDPHVLLLPRNAPDPTDDSFEEPTPHTTADMGEDGPSSAPLKGVKSEDHVPREPSGENGVHL